MEAVFIKLLNMSISASWLILVVVLLRFILRKAPKSIRCILWAMVGIRLVCPVSFESFLSLIPSAETVSPNILYSETPKISSGINIVNSAVNPVITGSLTPEAVASVNPAQVAAYAASIVWIIGIVIMLLYSIISYVHLCRKVITAVLLRDNIRQSEAVSSPFVLGLFRPHIYIPFNADEEGMKHVISHETAHIRRRDHWIKPLGFFILTIYWFNPLIWLAYILLCRDIELACDERVIKGLGTEEKKAYSSALLGYSVVRKMIVACPLAFGEVGVKQRIKNVLNYKKPAFRIIVVALISCIVVAVCFLTNPKDSKTPEASIADTLGLAEKDITVFGTYETWEDGWYILGFLASRSETDSDLGAALFHLENNKYTLDSYYRCKDGAIAQDRITVCSFSTKYSIYDVILSNNENLARVERTINGETDSIYIGGSIPSMSIRRYQDNEHSSVNFQFYDASGKRIDGYIASNTVLNMGEYEPNGIVSLASWSSSTKEYFMDSAAGTKFVITSDQFKASITDATSAAFVGNFLYENPQYVTADVGDKIEIMSSTRENAPEPVTLDVSSYSSKTCYQVLASDGTDTGYRIFRMDGETWIGHWGLYGTKKNGWWCEYIFKVGLSGASSAVSPGSDAYTI